MLRALLTSRWGNKKVLFEFAKMNTEDLVNLGELLAAGKIRSAIDRRYSLEQAVDAHSYIDSGQKQGHVVLTMV